MTLSGVMLLWWILTAGSLLFVTIDIWRNTPESPVLKWAFVILTAFTGPVGALFYVLACREPLQGTHEQYVSARWRQVFGSTMHCVAGDGIGIVVGAALGSVLKLPFWPGFVLEYALGFGFGWAFFQAFAMRGAAGSYLKSLKSTFLPELLSMNALMAGMLLTRFVWRDVAGAEDPHGATFWFIMSIAIMIGFAFAYPVNWWLVASNMKHGMLTVRADSEQHSAHAEHSGHGGHGTVGPQPGTGAKAAMTVLTTVILAAALMFVRLHG